MQLFFRFSHLLGLYGGKFVAFPQALSNFAKQKLRMSDNQIKIHKWLRPAAAIYGAVTDLRNTLYDKKVFSQYAAPFPVICIGNITAGGTGKTPQAEYLIRLLQHRFRTALLSRGYGRATKGYIRSTYGATPETIGDEPFQMSRKFPSVCVAVCEDRATGLKELERTYHPDVVILDDAFQHRQVRPSLSILLINWNRDIHSDCLIPAGLLREDVSGKSRADIIVVTKCPENITEDQMMEFKARIAPAQHQKVFFSKIEYGDFIPWDKNTAPRKLCDISPSTSVIVATGIASPQPVIDLLEQRCGNISHIAFPDHHRFTEKDIVRITEAYDRSAGNDRMLIVTEKDSGKMRELNIRQDIAENMHILPIETEFITDRNGFDDIIINHIENFSIR